MEEFRRRIKKRIILMRIYCAVVAALFTIGAVGNIFDRETNAVSFTLGVYTGTLFLVVINLRKYMLAMKYEENFKQLYIQETDERHQYIVAKTGGSAINIIIFSLALASIIAGFFSETIFFTLLGSVLFVALVKGSLKIYYNKTV